MRALVQRGVGCPPAPELAIYLTAAGVMTPLAPLVWVSEPRPQARVLPPATLPRWSLDAGTVLELIASARFRHYMAPRSHRRRTPRRQLDNA